MNIIIPSIVKNTAKVGDLHLSANILSSIDESIMIDGIRSTLEQLSSKTIFHYINNISFLKPSSSYILNVHMSIYDNPSMSSNPLCQFNSSWSNCSSYVEALLITNVEGENGTQWKKPDDASGMLGFGTEYNNAPVVVHLYDWMKDSPEISSIANQFNKDTQLYIRQEWQYRDDMGLLHQSDHYSQIVPTNTEQTAQRDIMNAISRDFYNDNQQHNVSQWQNSFYMILPNILNVLKNGIFKDDNDVDYDTIYLNNYSIANEYIIKFDAKSNVSIGQNNEDAIHICDENGYEIEELKSCDIQFQSGKTYLIKIFAGFIYVLAEKITS